MSAFDILSIDQLAINGPMDRECRQQWGIAKAFLVENNIPDYVLQLSTHLDGFTWQRPTFGLYFWNEYAKEFRNLHCLRGLSRLDSLYLCHTATRYIDDLSELPGLRRLSLCETHVHDIDPLQELKNLEQLTLEAIPATDFEPLLNLRNLRWLNLNRTAFRDLSLLNHWPRLERLSLWKTPLGEEIRLGYLLARNAMPKIHPVAQRTWQSVQNHPNFHSLEIDIAPVTSRRSFRAHLRQLSTTGVTYLKRFFKSPNQV